MTQYQKDQYMIRYELDNWLCQGCSKPATEQGHRIANTKVNRKVYGPEIIDHNMNIASSCQSCNSGFNIGNKPELCNILVSFIKHNFNKRVNTNEINVLLGK